MNKMLYFNLGWLLYGTCIWWTCVVGDTCESVQVNECFGTVLDYNFTSTDLVTDSKSQQDIETKLKQWEGLKFISKCWEVLQPLLCQVYKPRCDINGSVQRPCREQCLATRKPCSVVERYNKEWPDFLKCERFPVKGCNGKVSFSIARVK